MKIKSFNLLATYWFSKKVIFQAVRENLSPCLPAGRVKKDFILTLIIRIAGIYQKNVSLYSVNDSC
jgi:hypothetical protein